jgi:hypothetical protein
VTNPVLVVHRVVKGSEPPASKVAQGRACWTWCPACDKAHRFEILGEDGSHPPRPQGDYWTWDGNLEAPTFEPSMLVHWTGPTGFTNDNPAPLGYDGPSEEHRCHSFLRAGRWEFLADSTHALAGQTVDMVPLPDWLVKES